MPRTPQFSEIISLSHCLISLDHYIKPRTSKHNDKVERSHKTDKMEFYQLLDYTDDIDLKAKLAEWEAFYNYARPHTALIGKTPYERLKEKLC